MIISPWKREGPFIWIFRFFNWPSGSGEEDENVKSLQTNGQTDRRRTTGDQKSLLELSAQVSSKNYCIDNPSLLDIKSLTSMFFKLSWNRWMISIISKFKIYKSLLMQKNVFWILWHTMTRAKQFFKLTFLYTRIILEKKYCFLPNEKKMCQFLVITIHFVEKRYVT